MLIDAIVPERSMSKSGGVSPEVQNRRDIIRVQNRIANLGERVLNIQYNLPNNN